MLKNRVLSSIATVLLVGATLVMYSCKSSRSTGETTHYKAASAGQVYVKSSGFGKTKGSSVNSAIKNAFENLMLRGIPDSNQSLPMLGNNAQDVYQKKKSYFTNFYKKDVERFILSRDVSRYRFLNVNEPSTDVTLLINTEALRRHLESDGVIRSFGL